MLEGLHHSLQLAFFRTGLDAMIGTKGLHQKAPRYYAPLAAKTLLSAL